MTKKVVADKSKMEGMMQYDHNDHSDRSDHHCESMSDKYKVHNKKNIEQLHTNIDHILEDADQKREIKDCTGKKSGTGYDDDDHIVQKQAKSTKSLDIEK